MPELPEVETVRATLAAAIGGKRVAAVTVRRADVVAGLVVGTDAVTGDASEQSLLRGLRVADLWRHGKQLAMVGSMNGDASDVENLSCVCVHLGMSGSLRLRPAGFDPPAESLASRHAHVIWRLENGQQVVFHDPRRFGGVWAGLSAGDVAHRWARLGPDALKATPGQLHKRLRATRRCVKAALLDQQVIAGLGNIYVDESLHAAGLHPLTIANALDLAAVRKLVRQMRRILRSAIRRGGSTLRDYVDGRGHAGGFQALHRVYGRGGQPCRTCGQPLTTTLVAQRTTVWCERCQKLPGVGARRVG